jgi:hypothetical protein
MVPLSEQVNIPFFTQFINEQGQLVPNEISVKAADSLIKQLARWTKGLKLIKEDRA